MSRPFIPAFPVIRAMRLIERGRRFYAKAILGKFECPRCGHPGPHAMCGAASFYVCAGCEANVTRETAVARMKAA